MLGDDLRPTWERRETDKREFFESHDSFQEGMTVVLRDDGTVVFSVAEEQAVDSYNSSFECHYTMKSEDRKRLINLLTKGRTSHAR